MFRKAYQRHKEVLLKVSSILIVILFFVCIELIVRLVSPPAPADNMIDLGPINLFSHRIIDGETWYSITNKNAYSDRNVTFREKKMPNQIRIISLGGSASAGWPHPPDEIYSEYLERILQRQYPDKEVEIINCSAHGFASYRIRHVFESVMRFDPDAVIIWSGNNEFLEGRKYRTSELKNTLVKVRNQIRSLQLVRELFVEHRYDDTPEVADTFWKKVNKEALELRSDPSQFEKVKEHYQKSIEAILAKAQENDIRVLLMTVPVNLRDWEPNVSWLGEGADSARWHTLFKEANKHFLTGRYDDAVAGYRSALEAAPTHAETMFRLAKALQAAKDTVAALHYYRMARDYDYNPFRAIGAFNETLRQLAPQYPNAVLSDVEQRMNFYAEYGIPGFDLFLDYVHPTRSGNLVIATELANTIARSSLFGAPSQDITLDEAISINASSYRDEDDLYLQFTRFSLCCMTHQYHSALHFGKLLKEKIPPASFQNDPTGRMTILHDALQAFQAYIDLEQKALTSDVTAAEEERVMAGMRAFYAKHFPYGAY